MTDTPKDSSKQSKQNRDSDPETNSTTSRMKRYASVTSALSGTLARAATDKILGRDVDHTLQAFMMTKAMGKLKGPVMKIAQMLSTIPDAVPAEYAMEFQSLQADAPSMGWLFVKRRMKTELGLDWESKFTSFEREATSAASLGQVHKAVIDQNGTEQAVACKLQYPDMSSTVQADLNQLKLALKIYESTMGGVKTGNIYQEISERLYEELDYELEANTLRDYERIYRDAPLQSCRSVFIPHVIDELSTKRLLTMSWLEGKKVRDIIEAPQPYRNQIAATMFQAWYYPFFTKGFLHGDPHLGNYSFRGHEDGQNPGINLFDFGCIRRFPNSFVQGVKDLYHALLNNDKDQEVHAYEALGFRDLNNDLVDVLRQWAHLLYEPVLDDRVRPMQKDHSGIYGKEMAEKVHADLRKIGGVSPPREFVFMDRAAVGVGSLCLHLKAEQNWCQLYQELLEFSS